MTNGSDDAGPVRCTRFEDEGVLQLETNQPIDPHFATCEDCRRTRALHEAIRAELRHQGLDDASDPAWTDEVLAKIAALDPPRE